MLEESSKNTGLLFDVGTTCEHSRHSQATSGESILSAEVFPVRTSATPANEKDSPANALACGASSLSAFAFYDRATSSWRTWRRCLFAGWDEFSATWPRSGMTRNGIAYRQPPSVRLTSAKGCSLWPTPRCSMRRGATKQAALKRLNRHRIEDWCFLNSQRDSGVPNPLWIEWLLGFPPSWTDLTDSATP